MSLKITMQECHITRDMPVVKTRVPKERLEDGAMIAQAVRAMRLSAGDHVLVQSMNHEMSELLDEAEFVVISAVTSMQKVTKDDMSEQSVEQTNYTVTRKGEWWSASPEVQGFKETDADQADKVAPEVKRGPGRPRKAA